MAFFLASTEDEKKMTSQLYMVPVFSNINKWVARDFSDIQLGFFILIRDLKVKEITT
jgi:hypothetical protein